MVSRKVSVKPVAQDLATSFREAENFKVRSDRGFCHHKMWAVVVALPLLLGETDVRKRPNLGRVLPKCTESGTIRLRSSGWASGLWLSQKIEFPWPISQTILQHHERLDGSGYPEGICDQNIILEARVLAVADVVEAMSSHRPYRPALGLSNALEEISKGKGVTYDPNVVDACFSLFDKKRTLSDKFKGLVATAR